MEKKIHRKKPVSCKYCGSPGIRKYGFVEGIQRYFCNDCKSKFSFNDCLFKMKTPHNQVSSALNEYFQGSSINKIRRHLDQHYDNYPSSKTVYGWITRFNHEIVEYFRDCQPETGTVWILDETVHHVNNKVFWCIDVVDRDTCFLLASGLSVDHEKLDVVTILEQAHSKSKRIPERVLTDGWGDDSEIVRQAFNRDAGRIITGSFGDDLDIKWIEDWSEVLKGRTIILERLKTIEAGNSFMEGFQAYYNFLRPHERLGGKTPAEASKLKYTAKTCDEVICHI